MNTIQGSDYMSDRSSISKISSIKDSSNVYDKNNLRKKNNQYTDWDFPNKKGSSKNGNLMKNKKYKKKTDEINSVDDDKIEINYSNEIQENEERTKEEIIACKIARGEYVSKKDLCDLNEKNPELIKKAIVAGNQRKRLEEKLRCVNNNVDAQNIIFRHKELAIRTTTSSERRLLDGGIIKVIMLAAIDKAEYKYKNDVWDGDNIELEVNLIEAGIN